MHNFDFTRRLQRRGWLSRTPEAFRDAVLPICRVRRYKPGEALYFAGDEPGGIFGVCSGSVAVSIPHANTDMHFVHLFQPGTWFGEASMLTGMPRRVSAVARTDVVAANVPLPDLLKLLAAHPEWWRYIGCLSVGLNDFMTASGDDLMIRDNERRCIATVLRVCGCRFEDPEPDVVAMATVSHDELAAMANLARNTVGEILHRLVDQGLVELGYRTITVRESEKLRAMVDRAE